MTEQTHNPFGDFATPPQQSGSDLVWRGDFAEDGSLWYETADRDTYTIPRSGYYNLRVVGLGKPFDDPVRPEYRKEGKPDVTRKFHLEMQIMDGPHAGDLIRIGFVTTSLYDGSGAGSASNLYKIASVALASWTGIQDLLGAEFRAVLKPKLKTDGSPHYVLLAWDTCEPVEPDAATTDGGEQVEEAAQPAPALARSPKRVVPASSPFRKTANA